MLEEKKFLTKIEISILQQSVTLSMRGMSYFRKEMPCKYADTQLVVRILSLKYALNLTIDIEVRNFLWLRGGVNFTPLLPIYIQVPLLQTPQKCFNWINNNLTTYLRRRTFYGEI